MAIDKISARQRIQKRPNALSGEDRMMAQGCFDCEGWGIAAMLPTFKSEITYLGGIAIVVFLPLATLRTKQCSFREAAPYFIGSLFGVALLLVSRSEIASMVALVIAAWLPTSFLFVAVPLWLALKFYKLLAASVHRIATSRGEKRP